MPFYEYQCRKCGHHVEVLQKISDAPLKKCPACGRSQLARIVSRVAFRLKGGGWYETDFKSDGENKRNLVGDESAPAGDAKKVDPTAKADAAKTEATPGAEAPAKAKEAGTASKGAAKGGGRGAAKAAAKTPAKAKAAARPKAKAKPKAKRR